MRGPMRLIVNGLVMPEPSEEDLLLEAEDRAIEETRRRAAGQYVPVPADVVLPEDVGEWIEGLLDGAPT